MATWLGVAAVIALVLIGFIVAIQLVIMGVLLWKIGGLLELLHERLGPLMTKAERILTVVGDTAEHAQGKANTAIDATARAATTAADGAEKTARLAQRVVAWPMVTVLAAVDGVRGGVDAWRAARRNRRTARKCDTP